MKDLIFASPKMMETFQDFWVDEDLGSDHRAIIATFSSQPLTHDKPKKTILFYHKGRLGSYQQYNNERNDEATPRPHIINRNNRQLHINPHISHTNHNHTKCTTNRSQNTFHRHSQDNTRPVYRNNSYASRSHKANRGKNGRSCHDNQYAGGSHIISIGG